MFRKILFSVIKTTIVNTNNGETNPTKREITRLLHYLLFLKGFLSRSRQNFQLSTIISSLLLSISLSIP